MYKLMLPVEDHRPTVKDNRQSPQSSSWSPVSVIMGASPSSEEAGAKKSEAAGANKSEAAGANKSEAAGANKSGPSEAFMKRAAGAFVKWAAETVLGEAAEAIMGEAADEEIMEEAADEEIMEVKPLSPLQVKKTPPDDTKFPKRAKRTPHQISIWMQEQRALSSQRNDETASLV
ncbi:S-antigen protein-like [Thunnus thynnus]|uniref:S-antigen protein-like n=1 Tax=Thunnus thynnus TaxID=8237 RepID=UPI0035282AC8